MFNPKAIASPTVVGSSGGKKVVEHRVVTIQLRYALWLQAGIAVLMLAMFAKGLTGEIDKLHQAVGTTPVTALASSNATTSTTTAGK